MCTCACEDCRYGEGCCWVTLCLVHVTVLSNMREECRFCTTTKCLSVGKFSELSIMTSFHTAWRVREKLQRCRADGSLDGLAGERELLDVAHQCRQASLFAGIRKQGKGGREDNPRTERCSGIAVTDSVDDPHYGRCCTAVCSSCLLISQP